MKLFFILLVAITLQAQSISEIWESSSEHKEFTALLESGKVQQALKLKLNAINTITKEELHSFFLAFRQKYVQRYCEFPLGVREKMELTESSCNSPLSNIFLRCLVIAGLCTPKSSAILF
jgi:hypothetical protein